MLGTGKQRSTQPAAYSELVSTHPCKHTHTHTGVLYSHPHTLSVLFSVSPALSQAHTQAEVYTANTVVQ